MKSSLQFYIVEMFWFLMHHSAEWSTTIRNHWYDWLKKHLMGSLLVSLWCSLSLHVAHMLHLKLNDRLVLGDIEQESSALKVP
jgi:hypothetical protein